MHCTALDELWELVIQVNFSGWPLTWKTWKSQGIPKWSGKSQGKWKKSGEVKSCVFFQVLNTPKIVFRPGLRPGPHWGSLQHSPRSPSRLGRGTLHPFPQLLQPQLLNNWLSGLTLFFINMKQRLLTISVNTRYRVIFPCLLLEKSGKSQGISCGLESGHPELCNHCICCRIWTSTFKRWSCQKPWQHSKLKNHLF